MLVDTNNFKIESLGVYEDWVYDIEVEDCHNFFANNILVHNSGFFNIRPLVRAALDSQLIENDVHKIADYVDEWCKTVLEPKLAGNCQSLAEYLNAYENKLHFKREKIMPSIIFRAKKNYILTVIDSEGVRYNEPKFSGTGIEYKRSSTPDYIRPRLIPCYMIMLEHNHDNYKEAEAKLQEYIKDFKIEYMNADISDIAFPRGVSEIDKWLDSKGNIVKGAPIHVRASIYHNRLLKETGLYKKHPYIKEGEKMKFIYLKTPNIINNNAIGFIDVLYPEFELCQSIDKETQFNKSFLDPVKSFAELLNWSVEKSNNLNDLFGSSNNQRTFVKREIPIKPKTTPQTSLADLF